MPDRLFSSSRNYDDFRSQDQFKEEITETIGEPTMEEYMTKTRDDYGSRIARPKFDASNNEAEYEALIAGLRIAEQMGIKNLEAKLDSRLVANQVPRSENKKVDALSKIASTSFAHLTKQVLVEVRKEKLIKEKEILAVVEEEGDL
ncbi:reverse transcriptase domain-containing protein [Tanacetum coccineum]